MQELNLPKYEFRFKREDKRIKIFDEIRKKYIVLTEEEWVRQNFTRYLIEELHYPKGLIAIEKEMKWNNLKRRTDILVYSQEGIPILMVECKAANVKIDQNTLDQIGRYNIQKRLAYLIVTNGLDHYSIRVDFKVGKFEFLNHIPKYEELQA